MANYKETFLNQHVILPVVHVENISQTLKNVDIVCSAGTDGAFLISMRGMGHQELANIHQKVKEEFPDCWLGINYLDLPTIRTFSNLNSNISGLWVDDAGIDESDDQQINAEKINEVKEKSDWNGLYFGGVAFKYQKHVDQLEKVAQLAMPYMDVITTSGFCTGSAPDKEKIFRMKTAIGNKPLAIASGISPDNIETYLDVADCFLVATSLLVYKTEEFDPIKVRKLVNVVRG